MKNKKNQVIILLLFLISVIVSIGVETAASNYDTFLNNSMSISNILSNEQILSPGNDVLLQDDKTYSSKLVIQATSSDQVPLILTYLDDNQQQTTYKFIFNKENSQYTINLHTEVSELILSNASTEGASLNLSSISIDNGFHFSIYRFILFSLFICIVLLLICFRNKLRERTLPVIFTLLAFSSGFVMIISSTPSPGVSWDEEIHFKRSFEFLQFGSSYVASPAYDYSVKAETIRNVDSMENLEDSQEYINNLDYLPAVNYYEKKVIPDIIMTPYLPQSIGLHAGSAMNLPYSYSIMLGKLFNLITYIILCFFAIKKIPFAKKALFVFALMPTSLFLAAHFSYDTMVTGGLFLGLAYFLDMIQNKEKELTGKDIFVFLFSITLACFCKAIYAPLLLSGLAFKKTQFRSKKEFVMFRLLLIVLFIILLSTFLLPILSGSSGGDPRGGNTSTSRQIAFILGNPIGFVGIFMNNFFGSFVQYYASSSMYSSFSYVGLANETVSVVYLLLFIGACLMSTKSSKFLTMKLRILSIAACVIVTEMIWGALYLSFTPVGSSTINGVQPRYFIPLVFIVAVMLIPNIKNKLSNKANNLAVFGLSISMTVFLFIVLLIYFVNSSVI